MTYLRFQSATPNHDGHHPGVLALVNDLSQSGVLTDWHERIWRREKGWYQRNLLDPEVIDPSVYDRNRNPGAAAWFKSSATHLIDRVRWCTEILDYHAIAWICLRSADPGTIIYEDSHQIVARPCSHGIADSC